MTGSQDSPKTFGEVVRARRLAAKLTQVELAEQYGVTTPFISDIESDRRLPAREKTAELAKCLGMTEEELLAFDPRDSTEAVKHFLADNPAYAVAFRTAIDVAVKKGISATELVRRLKKG